MLFGKSKQAYYKRDLEHLSEELAREAFALEFAMAVRQTDPGIGCANLWRIYLREFEGSRPLGRDRFVALLHENDMQLRHRLPTQSSSLPRSGKTVHSRCAEPIVGQRHNIYTNTY